MTMDTKKAGAKSAPSVIPGSQLKPQTIEPGERQQRFWYHIGAMPHAPRESIDVAGISFPKTNAELVPHPQHEARRVPRRHPGALVALSREKLEEIAEKLPRIVFRSWEAKRDPETDASGENIGDRPVRTNSIQLHIPSDEELAELQKRGRFIRKFVPQRNDVYAADYLYMRLLPEKRRIADTEPVPTEPLSVTGIPLPPDDAVGE